MLGANWKALSAEDKAGFEVGLGGQRGERAECGPVNACHLCPALHQPLQLPYLQASRMPVQFSGHMNKHTLHLSFQPCPAGAGGGRQAAVRGGEGAERCGAGGGGQRRGG